MLYDQIPDDKKAAYLKDLLEYVVERNGLASVPKQDLEACFVYLYKKHVNPDIGLYSLSKIFKVKESKLKSLIELFYLKFEDNNKRPDDLKILDLLVDTRFQIESIEKVQIRFHFNKIEGYPLLQEYFRRVGEPVEFNKFSESIVVNQNSLYDVLNNIWETEKDKPVEKSEIKQKIQKIIGNIGNSLDNEFRAKLREQKKGEFYKALEYGSKLSGIGSFILNFYKNAPFKILES